MITNMRPIEQTRALVIGADGTIGAALARAWRQRGGVAIGTTRRATQAGGGDLVFLDLASAAENSAALPSSDVVFICAAMTKLDECRKNPDLVARINVDAPVAIAAQALKTGAKTVFLSTCAVFSGREPRVPADNIRDATSVYGRSKAEAEDRVLATGAGATVVRLTKVLTPGMPLLSGWAQALSRGDEIVAFDDHRIAPLFIDTVVDALIDIGLCAADGTFQLSAARDVSYAEIARHIATRCGVPPSLVQGRGAESCGIPPAEILPYTSLDVTRATDHTGFVAPDPLDAVNAVMSDVAGRQTSSNDGRRSA